MSSKQARRRSPDPWRRPGQSDRWEKPYRVLTTEQVTEIRRRCAAGEARKDVAAAFDVDPSHVSRIVLGHRRRDPRAGP